MKRPWVAGLVGAGGVGKSFLARMPAALAGLGPVKADSLRVARRLANLLRSGHPAGEWEQLEGCHLIWIALPEEKLDQAVAGLAAAGRLRRTMIVLCGSERDSLWPSPLRTAGARVASLNAIEGTNEQVFVAEGHGDTMRELRRILRQDQRKLLEIRPAAKPLYLAGLSMASHLILPWIAAAIESFRAAGFTRPEASQVVEALCSRSTRSCCKAGRKAWNRSAGVRLRQAAQDLETIRATDPRLASLFAGGIELALDYFEPPKSRHAAQGFSSAATLKPRAG